MRKRIQVDVKEETVDLLKKMKESDGISQAVGIDRAVSFYARIVEHAGKAGILTLLDKDGKELKILI